MKTILVDAKLKKMLDDFPNPKIIVTNANNQEQQTYGMVNLPYPLFTMAHKPNKTEPEYFRVLCKEFSLSAEKVIYFEHHPEAVKTAKSLGITTYHFDHEARNIKLLQAFIAAAL